MKVLNLLQSAVLISALSQAPEAPLSSELTSVGDIEASTGSLITIDDEKSLTAAEVSTPTEEEVETTLGAAYLSDAQVRQLGNFLMGKEGYHGSMYTDELGNQAIGYGRVISRSKGGLTEQEARDLMISKVKYFENLLVRNAPWTRNLDKTRYGALLNMSFQLGVGSASRGTGVLGFRTAMNQIRTGAYAAGGRSLLNSRWARQTPNRARRIARQIETGNWQIEGRYRPTSDMYANLFAQLRVDEGYKPYAYKDSLGYWTLGIGILIDPRKGGKIDAADARALVYSHVRNLDRQFATTYRWYTSLDDGRKGGLIAYAYKLSFATLQNFRKALDAMANRDFDRAARELMDSSFGKRAPAKARAYANLVRNPRMPSLALATVGDDVEMLSADAEEDTFAFEGAMPEVHTADWEDVSDYAQEEEHATAEVDAESEEAAGYEKLRF